ncbi:MULTISPECIES: ATP/GTP-binding protein [unclassified Streptomyces]|uniref:ATP/GTP-binding protein n=1 Tax=unclassified Streptomyces TaxID=2593676 RepID=UPI002E1E106F|nr:ATP/GTP-binding protein [Streptomyces sp. NBC_00963]
MLRKATGTVGLAIVLTLAGAPIAEANPHPKPTIAPPTDCGDMSVCIGAGVGGSDSKPAAPEHGPTGKTAARKPGKKPTCDVYAGPGYVTVGDPGPQTGTIKMPCNDPELGQFSGGCYYKTAQPQPPASDPAWKGHKPGSGAIYQRTCPIGTSDDPNNTQLQGFVWMAKPPAAAAVDPAQLAREAVDKMTLLGPRIGITPKPGGKGVVGMPVYMWTAKGAETYGPNVASASAGGVTVKATAKVSKIVWNLGDGSSVTCTTAGTPYRAEYGKNPSPDCGHHYSEPSSTQPSGKFHVTATSTWSIDWQGGGQTGQLTEVRNSAVDITVVEVQVLN